MVITELKDKLDNEFQKHYNIILVNGTWEIGKTYYLKDYLQNNKYIYISLFGIDKLEGIKYAIYYELNKIGACINKFVNNNSNRDVGISFLTLPIPNISSDIQKKIEKKLKKESLILVIDDLERKTGDINEDSGNYTLLDIAKSLDWINENIEAFGGNPNNITASGFSAGGRDIMAMLISPIFEGKFQKAIAFSGGMTISDPEESAQIIAKAIAPLVIEDNVKETEEDAYNWLLTDDTEVKDYLYSLFLTDTVTGFGASYPEAFNNEGAKDL